MAGYRENMFTQQKGRLPLPFLCRWRMLLLPWHPVSMIFRSTSWGMTCYRTLSSLAVEHMKNLLKPHVVMMHCKLGMSSGRRKFGATGGNYWNGHTERQHAALLKAIGEMEPEAIPEAVEHSKAWSPAILPADDRTNKVVFNQQTHFHSAAAIADWHGNADDQHTALLQAIGESVDWSFLPL